jgi:peptidoglycan/xylan/chitin deacetylase (PgdA/CDA1 family)
MVGNGLVGVRTPAWIAMGMSLLACFSAQAALAADCPGHPDALGTSRTLVVDPREHSRIGTMQYAETLPLEDHEVVLTFDDGPLPRNSNQVLDILASQCVKATFFIIGRMARAYPEGVRKVRAAGHSIGTHSEDHPLSMNRMPIERARQEIDDGIASVKSALGDDTALAPFFRIPGLLRAEAVEDYLISQGIQTWSADFPADDWRHISSARVYDLALSRIEAKGKGILLLHDIQARTVAALPRILAELKARGYRIVHVVPATAELAATPTEPSQWRLHPMPEAVAHWPKIPDVVVADAAMLAAPLLADLDWPDVQPLTSAELSDRAERGGAVPRQDLWPRQGTVPPDLATALPIPAQNVFEIRDGLRTLMQGGAPLSRRAQLTVPAHGSVATDAGSSPRTLRDRPHPGQVRQAAARANRHVAHGRRGALRHLVQVRKKSV